MVGVLSLLRPRKSTVGDRGGIRTYASGETDVTLPLKTANVQMKTQKVYYVNILRIKRGL